MALSIINARDTKISLYELSAYKDSEKFNRDRVDS